MRITVAAIPQADVDSCQILEATHLISKLKPPNGKGASPHAEL
jgi:hypothetical protein